jgi:heme exporter protein D
MELGPHAGFIVAAYAAAAIVIGVLIVWVIADHRVQARALADLEAKGQGRRGREA